MSQERAVSVPWQCVHNRSWTIVTCSRYTKGQPLRKIQSGAAATIKLLIHGTYNHWNSRRRHATHKGQSHPSRIAHCKPIDRLRSLAMPGADRMPAATPAMSKVGLLSGRGGLIRKLRHRTWQRKNAKHSRNPRPLPRIDARDVRQFR